MRKRCLFLIYMTAILLCLTGCENKKEEIIEGTGIFYLNTSGTGLVKEKYVIKGASVHDRIHELLLELQAETECIDYVSPVPAEVELEKWKRNSNKLDLYFNVKYNDMDSVAEVLLRTAFVQTLTQIEEVEYVAFYAAGQPVTDDAGKEIGYQSTDDFIQNIGSTLHSYQKGELKLYFADSSGKKLKEETANVRYNSNMSIEKLVVEELIEGPMSSKYQATFANNTKVLGISTKNNICYINFDDNFLTNSMAIDPYLTIYSLVNSIIENGNVSKVQILVNGEANVKYQESVDLSQPFSKNLDIIEEEK